MSHIVLDKEDTFFVQFFIDLIWKHLFDNQAVVSDKVTSDQGIGKDFFKIFWI